MKRRVETRLATRSSVVARFHWPALDGLRGVAVISVILFHAASAVTPNGFTGVDVFFGLSGFLITALLLREHANTGRINLPQFYARRILRLYPALVLACLGVLVLAVLSDNLRVGGPAILAALLYVSHLWIYSGHDGWLLEHTWTLSLEEHYYLIWPGLMIGLLAVRWRRVAALALAVAVLIVLASPWVLPDGIRAAYARGTPMIYGSLAAIVWWRLHDLRSSRLVNGIGNLSLMVVAVLIFWPTPLPQQWLTGATSVPGILAVVLVVTMVASPTSIAARGLDWSPLKWTGRRAYGLYLYHFPILSIFAHHISVGPAWLRGLIGVVVSVLVAAASYRWLELPFLRLKRRFSASEAGSAPASLS